MARYDTIGTANYPGGGASWSPDGVQHDAETSESDSDMSPEREHALTRSWSYAPTDPN